ncbi:MAG: right-handed parallel beta-helix repeat-containing protein [bacterium]
MLKKIVGFIFITICFSIFPHASSASTNVTADITSDTTWDISGSPYVLTNDIHITSGATLTITKGVIVENGLGKRPLDLGFTITSGNLLVQGTSDQRVTFKNLIINGTNASITLSYADVLRVQVLTKSTVDISYGALSSLSLADSSIATVSHTTIDAELASLALAPSYIQGRSILHFDDGVIRNMSPNGNALQTRDNVTVTLTNSLIEADAIGVTVTVDSSVTFEKCTVQHAKKAGIFVEKHPTEPWDNNRLIVHDSVITQNEHGIEIRNAPVQVAISGDSFVGNTIAVDRPDPVPIVIGENWWNSANGPKNTTSNPDGDGEAISDSIVVKSWLKSNPFETKIQSIDAHTPVIIIPGIAGTQLLRSDTHTEVWPNIAEMIRSTSDSFLDYLRLDASGKEQDSHVDLGDIIREYPQVHIFNSLITSFTSRGYVEGKDLFVFPYDWRMSVGQSAQRLQQTITSVLATTGYSDVTLIAHSMGGLVAKQYIANEGDAHIHKLIFLGTPHLGAPKAFTMLEFGDNLGASVLGFNLLNPKRIFALSQNLPSVYDLLPTKTYIDGVGRGLRYVRDLMTTTVSTMHQAYLDYENTKQLLIRSGRNTSLFPQAEDLHTAIDSLHLPESKTYNYSGCGRTKTIGSVTLRKKFSWTSTGRTFVDDYDLGYVNGDDTVPLASSLLDGVQQLFVRGASHSTLPSASGVPESIQAVISGEQNPSSDNVSTDKTTCGVSGTIVSKHSPVRMDIYDTNGNHTGPVSDGTIEYGIDGVTYDEIGEDAFAFLPSGTSYRVTNTATDVGGYDFRVKKIDCYDVVTKEYYFHDIPIALTGVVSRIQIDDALNTPTLVVDAGEGIDGAVYAPSSTVSGSAVDDSVAPISSASFSDTGILTLSASDADSGVLEIEYSIDGGVTWNQYQSSFDASGATVQYFAIDSVGNTEDVKTVTVPEKKEEKHEDTSIAPSNNTTNRNSGSAQLISPPDVPAPTQAITQSVTPIHTLTDTSILVTQSTHMIDSSSKKIANAKHTGTIKEGVNFVETERNDVLRADAQHSGFVVKKWMIIVGLLLLACVWYFIHR